MQLMGKGRAAGRGDRLWRHRHAVAVLRRAVRALGARCLAVRAAALSAAAALQDPGRSRRAAGRACWTAPGSPPPRSCWAICWRSRSASRSRSWSPSRASSRRRVYPLIVFLQIVPKIAIAPLFIIWFGFGFLPKLLLVFLLSFFPIVVSSIAGFKSLDPDVMDLARSTGAGSWRLFLKIRLPQALPDIFTGLKVGAALAATAAVVAEFVASNKGLGYLLLEYNGNLETGMVFAVIIVLEPDRPRRLLRRRVPRADHDPMARLPARCQGGRADGMIRAAGSRRRTRKEGHHDDRGIAALAVGLGLRSAPPARAGRRPGVAAAELVPRRPAYAVLPGHGARLLRRRGHRAHDQRGPRLRAARSR